eukprot:6226185-Pyramimonas_sp.AAC.1
MRPPPPAGDAAAGGAGGPDGVAGDCACESDRLYAAGGERSAVTGRLNGRFLPPMQHGVVATRALREDIWCQLEALVGIMQEDRANIPHMEDYNIIRVLTIMSSAQ